MKRPFALDPAEVPVLQVTTLRRIFAYLAPYRGRGILVCACIVGAALLNLAPAILVKRLIDDAVPARDMRLLLVLCAGMLVGPLIAGALQVAQKYLTSAIGESVMLDLRVAMFRHLHRQSLSYFSTARPGETISRVLNDVEGIGQAVARTLLAVLENALILGTTATLVILLDWRLAIIALVLLPAFIVPTRRVGRRRKLLKRSVQARLAELTGILSETLSVSGALLVKVSGAEEAETERLAAKGRELRDLSLRQTLVGRWFQMLLGLFESAGPALVFAGGGLLVIGGHLGLGTVVAFVTLLKRLYTPASQLAGVHVDLVTSYAYFDRVFAVLDHAPSIISPPDALSLSRARGRVEFRNVSFSYAAGEPLLRGIDLEVHPGQCLAIVGASGAGKSSLAALVPRLYDVTDGAVLVDGHDVRSLELASLRANIGMVTQDTYLFHASILDNLRYARPGGASEEEVHRAARAAQIHDFIVALPDGYQTMVGERGNRLAGGERQRLAIARAILKDPSILILDEATSSLDTRSEYLIQAALQPLLAGRTSLVIAHRLSTIRRADEIVVLQRGRIVERGTHAELLARRGAYAGFHDAQEREAA
jgi:ATP-binding cassette subfamily B protein